MHGSRLTATEREQPTITGACIWSANLPATVLLVEMAGAILDGFSRPGITAVTQPKAIGNPRGRPSKFDPDRAASIISRMMDGQDVNSACRAERVRPSTFRTWANRDVEGLFDAYAKAQAVLALIREDEAWGMVERGAKMGVAWRFAFSDRWLPARLRPGN